LTRYVIDAWAWIEYLIGSKHGSKLKEILDDTNNEVFTCAVTLAEVVSKVAKEKRDFEAACALLLSNSRIIDADENISKLAGLLHAEIGYKEKDFGLADSYVLATARKLGVKVLTGDPHFKSIKDAVLIK